MSRDPRVDPKPGDVLRKKYQGQYFESRAYRDRQVSEVDSGIVRYVGDWCCEPAMKLASWRRWAKDATVVSVAPEDR
jgi:hypothetical protein